MKKVKKITLAIWDVFLTVIEYPVLVVEAIREIEYQSNKDAARKARKENTEES